MYLAIIGDLVNSKRMTSGERRQVQAALKDCLKAINQEFADDIASDFLITLGDEFQGLLRHGDQVLTMVERIQQALVGRQLRFGLGIGSIFTSIENIAIGADGPAYHLARQALETIKQDARRSERPKTAIRLETDQGQTRVLNQLFAQLYHQQNNWTAKQLGVVWGMATARSQQDLANRLNVSQPYINQVLQATGYYTYRASHQAIIDQVKDWMDD